MAYVTAEWVLAPKVELDEGGGLIVLVQIGVTLFVLSGFFSSVARFMSEVMDGSAGDCRDDRRR